MLTPDEQRVLDAVSADRLVRTCADLVRIPTVNPYSGDRAPSGERAGQEYVAEVLSALGAEVERLECLDGALAERGILAPRQRLTRDRPNVIGRLVFGTGRGPRVLIDAHVDTVAVDEYPGEPFSGAVEDGCIWGRGASDDKSGVTVMLEAARALRDAGPALDGTLFLCSVVEEECDGGGRGSLTCLNHLPRPDAAILVDGDATALRNGCSGVVTAEITVQGRPGHAAHGNTVNAIEKAAALFAAFDRFREARGNRPGDFNLGVFRAGTHPANVPREARLGLNLRTGIEDMRQSQQAYGEWSGRTVRELFESHLRQAVAGDAFMSQCPPAVRWVKDMPAVECAANSAALLDLAQTVCREVDPARTGIAPMGGWGDIAHFIQAGIATVGLGGSLGLSGTIILTKRSGRSSSVNAPR